MKKKKASDIVLIVIMALMSISFLYPIFLILFNSFKQEMAISTNTVFTVPTAETFAGMENYVNALTSKGFFTSFCYSLLVTVTSVAAICLLCSMCA